MISTWPSLAKFAADARVSYGAAKKMRARGSIRIKYWPAIIDGACRRGIPGVSSESLMAAHTAAKAAS
ncbi:MAG: hypothetical protein K2X68_02635 [Novosphingobium sp.]|nr:hypothetical protein [Novosphingobium sp.]